MMDRREFMRGVVGLGLVGGVSLLVSREAKGDCEKRIGCGKCEAFGSCELPRAKENKPSPSRFSRPEQGR
jgi:hypothetical protein